MGGGLLNNLSIKKTKGFTLIELLAVIVVLAIIALIAVPIVLNIIEDARKGAAIASTRSYIKAVETYIISSELDKNEVALINNNKYNVTTTTTIDSKIYESINDLVEVKGSFPIGNEDYIKIDKNNQVEEALLTINGYVILIRYDEVISITKGSIISVENIILDKTNENLEIGKTLQLNATIIPNNATNKIVTWTSSDKNIASVDNNGLVTGLKAGNTIITAKASNGKIATANIIVSSISAKKDVDTNIEHGTNKDIVSTYFDVTGDINNVTCKVGNVEVSSTDDIAEKVGINNTYKVTCSTATGSASIDLKVANKLYLYKDGNEFTNITGGYDVVNYSSGYGLGTFKKNDTNFYLESPSYGKRVGTASKKTIDISNYSKISAEFTYYQNGTSEQVGGFALGIVTDVTERYTGPINYVNIKNGTYNLTLSGELPDNINSGYIRAYIDAGGYGGTFQSVTLYKIWLER